MLNRLFKSKKPNKKPAMPFTNSFSRDLNYLILNYLTIFDLKKLEITQSSQIDLNARVFLQIPAEILLKNNFKILLTTFGQWIDRYGLRKMLVQPDEINAKEDTLDAYHAKYLRLYGSIKTNLFKQVSAEQYFGKQKLIELVDQSVKYCCYTNAKEVEELLAAIQKNNHLIAQLQNGLTPVDLSFGKNTLNKAIPTILSDETLQLIHDREPEQKPNLPPSPKRIHSSTLFLVIDCQISFISSPEDLSLFYKNHISYFNPPILGTMFKKKSFLHEKVKFIERIQKKFCEYFDKTETLQEFFPDKIRDYYDLCQKVFNSNIFSASHEKIGVDPVHRNWLEKRVLELGEMLCVNKLKLSK